MRRQNFGTKSRKPVVLGIVLGLFLSFIYCGNDLFLQFESPKPSQSFGTTGSGHIQNAKRLPTNGPNFETYSRFGAALGRNSVHQKVRKVVLESYANIYKTNNELRFVYGETGWPWGGDFYPHKTHKNGMSVDFMVPVLKKGKPDTLPHAFWEAWAYKLEFDKEGKLEDYVIDFDAIVIHLNALAKSAEQNGLQIRRVIFAPDLQKTLKKAKGGKALLRKLNFSKGESWVRHDDHYHVDFK